MPTRVLDGDCLSHVVSTLGAADVSSARLACKALRSASESRVATLRRALEVLAPHVYGHGGVVHSIRFVLHAMTFTLDDFEAIVLAMADLQLRGIRRITLFDATHHALDVLEALGGEPCPGVVVLHVVGRGRAPYAPAYAVEMIERRGMFANLQTLIMEGCGITDVSLAPLLHSLCGEVRRTLRRPTRYDQEWDGKGQRPRLDSDLLPLPHLHEVRLGANAIRDMAPLGSLLRFRPEIVVLDVSSNDITSESFAAFANLSVSSGMKDLLLRDTPLGNGAILALASLLADEPMAWPSLQRLDLRCRFPLLDAPFSALGSALARGRLPDLLSLSVPHARRAAVLDAIGTKRGGALTDGLMWHSEDE